MKYVKHLETVMLIWYNTWSMSRFPRSQYSPEFWIDRGHKIAYKTVEQLKAGKTLERRIILPADRRHVAASTFEDLIRRSNRKCVDDLFVDAEEPVVKGYLEGMQVERFEELKSSPLLDGLGFYVQVDGIFTAEDYRPHERDALIDGIYLPGVAIDFLPVSNQLTIPSFEA